MSANYSEFNSEEEFLDIFNISSEHEILLNNSHHAVNEFGFVNIFDESTSATLQFVLAGVLLTAVAFFGVLGNILSIFVLSQKKIHASLTVLLIALSLCDLFVCVLLIIVKGLPILLKYFQIGSSYLRLICVPKKIIYPILQSVQLGSTYFTVAITGERLFAVIWPLESRSFCTYRNSKRLSVGIGIFSILSNSLMFYTTSQRQEVFHETNLSCQSLPPTDIPEYVNHLRLGIYVVVHYLFPLIAVILANVIIVRKIHTKNAKRETLTQNQLKEIKLTNMLIVVVLVYVICNIFRVINSFTTNIFNATYGELVALTDFLVSFNSAVNYLIYCAYGKSFRDSFVKIFCKCGKDHSRRRSDSILNETVVQEMSAIKSIRKFSKDVMTTFGKSQKYNIRD